jgi:hypothetical protein
MGNTRAKEDIHLKSSINLDKSGVQGFWQERLICPNSPEDNDGAKKGMTPGVIPEAMDRLCQA